MDDIQMNSRRGGNVNTPWSFPGTGPKLHRLNQREVLSQSSRSEGIVTYLSSSAGSAARIPRSRAQPVSTLALSRCLPGLFLLLLVPLQGGCEEVDGGAADFSWILRTYEDEPVRDCRNANIGEVEICWGPNGCNGESETRRFLCERGRGLTGFEIPEGLTFLQIRPICLDGSAPVQGSFVVPAAISRTSFKGKVMSLNSFLIVVSDQTNSDSVCPPSGCTCVR